MLKSILTRYSGQCALVLMQASMSLLLASTTAKAAEVGRAQLDGREIIIHDNKTWQYADERDVVQNSDCVTITSNILPLSVCLDESTWKNGSRNAVAEFTFATKGDDLFLMVIPEKNVLNMEAYEAAIINNAQSAAGLKPVKVVDKELFGSQGLEWGKIIYDAEINKLQIRYQNYYTTIPDKGSVQFIFYTTPRHYDRVLPEMEKAVRNFRINN